MRMVDLILKKRNGEALNKEEIYFWINGYIKGEIPDYQSSAMTMAICFKGMNKDEVSILTEAMLNSGETLDLSAIKGLKVDKHSTGGVGDKTTLVLAPMVAACGVAVAKLSGRGLGHTGGTLDKLESIPGLTININEEDFKKQVNAIGLAIAGQTKSLVPADKKLYALRDVTGTVESIPLIASSVMSKKLASGSDAILLDVTVGEGAFMKNIDQARELAKTMVDIGKSINRDTRAIISDMSEPLGMAIGNALEIKEAVMALKGQGPKDLMELCYEAGAIMLIQAHVTDDKQKAYEMLKNSITSGLAYKKFKEMVFYQGGDTSYLDNLSKFPTARYTIPIYSEKEGYLHTLNALNLGLSSMRLGAGRETINDNIDVSAGILLNKKVGDYIKCGDLLATIYTSKDNYQEELENIKEQFVIKKEKCEPLKIIKEIIE